MAIGDFNVWGGIAGAGAGLFAGGPIGAGIGFIAGGFGVGAATGPSTSGEGAGAIVTKAITGRDLLPSLFQKCEVSVYGNPRATRSSLYWQAAAIAFGQVRPRAARGFAGVLSSFAPPASSITLNWNTEEKAVHFVLMQIVNWAYINVSSDPVGDSEIQLFMGPPDECRGGTWQFFPGATAKPFPLESKLATGYEGLVEITPNPIYTDRLHPAGQISQSPFPPGDGNSRGYPTNASDPSVTIRDNIAWYTNPEYLLYAALSTPCGTGENTFNPDPIIDATITTRPRPTGIGGPVDTPWWFNITLPVIPPLGSSPEPIPPPRPIEDGSGFPFEFPPPDDNNPPGTGADTNPF